MQFVYGKSKVKAAGVPVPEPGDLAFVSAKAGRNQDETGRPGYAAHFAEITLQRRKNERKC